MPQTPNRRATLLAAAALGVAVVSLTVNAVLLSRVRHPERVLAPALLRALDRLEAQDAVIHYEVRLPAGTPVHMDIPVDQTYRLRLDTTLPIDTEVVLPIRSPLGNRNVRVPVKADVPIRTDLPVHLRDTFRLRTEVQTEIVVPLEIQIGDLPLDALRQSLETARP